MFSNRLKKLRGRWLVLRFLLVFILFTVPLYLVLYSPLSLMPLQQLISDQVVGLLNLGGIWATSSSNLVIFNTRTGSLLKVVIVRECVGWMSFLAFIGLVFATPNINKKYRLFGLLIGLPVIWFVNLIRLFTTFYITYLYGLGSFEVVHTFLWRVSLILFIFILWVLWFRVSKKCVKG